MTPTIPQRLLNEHEVATSCSISVLTLRKWRGQKHGPQFVKIGALVRYRPADVDAWIAAQKGGGAINHEEVMR